MKLSRVLFLILALSAAAFSQTNRGGISGTITDSSGAGVPGAKVTVTNAGTNQSVTVTTSNEGTFSVSSLEPVTYNVTVEANNFKKSVVQSIKVDTATVASVDVMLEAGSIAEQVTVEADAQTINAESGTTSQTITERQLQDLPLNNRSVLDLAMTMPNVAGDAGSEDAEVTSSQPVPGFNLSVNGGRPGSTAILADGVNNTGVGIARAVVSFTPETVQEFTVQTSAYSAEFGSTGGGVINVTTKSGTNRFTGTALVYHRNPEFNARPWRQGSAPRPANNLRYTQGSLTIGGPIFLPAFNEGGPTFYDGRDKSFFFFAVEPRWRTDFVTTNQLLPTLAERNGDFRGLVRTNSGFLPSAVAAQFGQTSIGPANIYQQFTLNANGSLSPIILGTGQQYCQFGDTRAILNAQGQPVCTTATNATAIPALNVLPQGYFDPISRQLLQYMPEPGAYFLDNGLVRNYVLNRSVEQNETRYTMRLDHNFTDNFKTNFRYTKTPAIGIRGAGNDINGNTAAYSDAQQYLLSFTNIFNSSMFNELKLNYTRGNFSEDFSPEYSIKSGTNFSGQLGLASLTTGGLPLILMSSDSPVSYSGADLGAGGSTNNFNVEERYNINDIFYLNRGNMTWKFGVDLSDARLSSTPFFAASGGRWNFRVVNTSNNRGTGTANGGNSLASFLLGVPNAVEFRPALYDYQYQWLSGAAFVQNDWKVKPNLTLNLGVRYTLQLPRTEKNNLQGVYRPDITQNLTLTEAQRRAIATASGIQTTAAIPDYVPTTAVIPAFAFSGRGGRSRYLTPIDKKAIEPRFGFAWSPKMKIFGMNTEDYSLVIRGGYGISHAPITGNNRSPNPDFGGFTSASTLAAGSSGGSNNAAPIRFSGNNAVQGSSVPLDTLLGTTADGLVFGKSLVIPAFAVLGDDKEYGSVPYSQNFNLAMQFSVLRGTSVELAYVGNRGVHLYMPQVNLNLRDAEIISLLEANGLNATANVTDPLGRQPLLGGAAIGVPLASLYTPYLGFDVLNKFLDPSANSIRHAGYIDVRRRISRGLSFTANYTFGKSIDDASDASPETRVLTTGSVRGQVGLGGTRANDRAVSSFDVRHSFSATSTFDLPIGKGRFFLKDAPWYVDTFLGGWTMSGITRINSGTPFQPFVTDPNKLGGTGLNRVVRPDIVSGVPLKNPRWDPDCRTGNACEPYVNPAAFMRPVKGELGNAPRTVNLRAPTRKFFDLSFQKDFPLRFLGGEGRRRIQLRMDLLNAFNMPVFQINNTGNTPFGLGTFPTEITTENVGGINQPLSYAEYNIWAAFNGQPTATSGGTGPGNVLYNQIVANVNAVRLPPRAGVTTGGALPNNFFSVRLPEGFATTNPLSFDIRTLEGFKLYRLRNAYDINFGTLGVPSNLSPRYIQFGLKFMF